MCPPPVSSSSFDFPNESPPMARKTSGKAFCTKLIQMQLVAPWLVTTVARMERQVHDRQRISWIERKDAIKRIVSPGTCFIFSSRFAWDMEVGRCLVCVRVECTVTSYSLFASLQRFCSYCCSWIEAAMDGGDPKNLKIRTHKKNVRKMGMHNVIPIFRQYIIVIGPAHRVKYFDALSRDGSHTILTGDFLMQE